jgi:hypothetical protein
MSTTQWILNLLLLGWVLTRNLGTRPVSRTTLATPLVVVAAAGIVFLRHLPVGGRDLWLDATGLAAGLVLGVLAASLTRVRRRNDGAVVIRAGAAFASVWILAIGGRIAFAEWATGSGARTVADFSVHHQITGADAWTAAFVLMALAMVLTRTAATGMSVLAAKKDPVHDSAALVAAGRPVAA